MKLDPATRREHERRAGSLTFGILSQCRSFYTRHSHRVPNRLKRHRFLTTNRNGKSSFLIGVFSTRPHHEIFEGIVLTVVIEMHDVQAFFINSKRLHHHDVLLVVSRYIYVPARLDSYFRVIKPPTITFHKNDTVSMTEVVCILIPLDV